MVCNLNTLLATRCGDLQSDLVRMVNYVALMEQIKVRTASHDPTWYELGELWGGEPVPPASMVLWYNTVSAEVSLWFTATGDRYMELTS